MGSTISGFDERNISINFTKFNLTKAHITIIFLLFKRIATNSKSGIVSVFDVLKFLNVKCSTLTTRAFNIVGDRDNINFKTFFLHVWNFCTLSPEDLAAFVFSIYDDDGSGILDLTEAIAMMHDISGKSQFSTTSLITLEMAQLLCSGNININRFHLFLRDYPMMLEPALQFQLTVKVHTLGIEMWKCCAESSRHFCNAHIADMELFLSQELECTIVSNSGNNSRSPSNNANNPTTTTIIERARKRFSYNRPYSIPNKRPSIILLGQGGGANRPSSFMHLNNNILRLYTRTVTPEPYASSVVTTPTTITKNNNNNKLASISSTNMNNSNSETLMTIKPQKSTLSPLTYKRGGGPKTNTGTGTTSSPTKYYTSLPIRLLTGRKKKSSREVFPSLPQALLQQEKKHSASLYT